MNSIPATNQCLDPAAQFAIAYSLWQACHDYAGKTKGLSLSEAFNGMDECMRVVMKIGELFERWACEHVNFDNLNDVWPYLLQDKFGDACLTLVSVEEIADFAGQDCLRLALALRLPVSASDGLPVPLSLWARNPTAGSSFGRFLIQTVRSRDDDGNVECYQVGDEPYDDAFTAPWFALYGELEDGKREHIADRASYETILNLARNLVPGIDLPDSPCSAPPNDPWP